MFIEVENIRKSYGRKTTVLNSASFHAARAAHPLCRAVTLDPALRLEILHDFRDDRRARGALHHQ